MYWKYFHSEIVATFDILCKSLYHCKHPVYHFKHPISIKCEHIEPMTDDIIFIHMESWPVPYVSETNQQDLNHNKHCLHHFALQDYFTTIRKIMKYGIYLVTQM